MGPCMSAWCFQGHLWVMCISISMFPWAFCLGRMCGQWHRRSRWSWKSPPCRTSSTGPRCRWRCWTDAETGFRGVLRWGPCWKEAFWGMTQATMPSFSCAGRIFQEAYRWSPLEGWAGVWWRWMSRPLTSSSSSSDMRTTPIWASHHNAYCRTKCGFTFCKVIPEFRQSFDRPMSRVRWLNIGFIVHNHCWSFFLRAQCKEAFAIFRCLQLACEGMTVTSRPCLGCTPVRGGLMWRKLLRMRSTTSRLLCLLSRPGWVSGQGPLGSSEDSNRLSNACWLAKQSSKQTQARARWYAKGRWPALL